MNILKPFAAILAVIFLQDHPAAAEGALESKVYAKRGDRELRLHLHFPADWKPTDKRPGIIFFFGGGWTSGSVNQFEAQARHFASRGMIAARADYRIKSKDGVMPDDCTRDARSAMRWMKKHADELGMDPDKLVASGGSAGGHLAACTMIPDGVDAADDDLRISPKPVAMVLFNPVLTFTYEGMADRLGDRKDAALKISPVDHLTKETPPSLALFGSDDRLIALSEQYWKKSAELGVRSDKWIAEGQSHGFFNREPWQTRTLKVADDFLVSLGLLEGSSGLKEDAPWWEYSL